MTLNFGLSNYFILKAIYILLCRLRKSRNVVETYFGKAVYPCFSFEY